MLSRDVPSTRVPRHYLVETVTVLGRVSLVDMIHLQDPLRTIPSQL